MPKSINRSLTPKQKRLVEELSEKVRTGNTEPMGKTLKRVGYSDYQSKRPSIVMNSKNIKRELKPIVQQLEELRQKAIDAINSRDLRKERLDSQVNLMKQATHDSQVLSGGSTGNLNLIIDESVALKYGIQKDTKS